LSPMPRQIASHDPVDDKSVSKASDILVLTGGRPAIVRTRARAMLLMFGGATASAALVAALVFYSRSAESNSSRQASVGRVAIPANSPDLSVVFSTDILPLTVEDAQKLNDERPIEVATVAPARPFAVKVPSEAKGRFQEAVRCLAQAIYYEAGGEPEEGQRAVAQIVLNRVRHPAFPHTVCGVVYQGSERVTGCQFTFTCDGSLARNPVPSIFARSERLAREALGGRVAAAVGNAVNYHADYVVPYWAASLAKVAKIGTHIFYGFRGALGDRSAFRSRYEVDAEGVAPLIAPENAAGELTTALTPMPGTTSAIREPSLAEDLRSGQLLPDASNQPLAPGGGSILEADRTKSELVVGNSALKSSEEKVAPQPSTSLPAPN